MHYCCKTPTLSHLQTTLGCRQHSLIGLGRWQFALEEQVSHPSNGGPLFVGSLPARQPDAYYALLPMRVPKMAKARIPGIQNGFFAT